VTTKANKINFRIVNKIDFILLFINIGKFIKDNSLKGRHKMIKLTHSCLITNNVKRLRDFYEEVLTIKPQIDSDTYIEFQMVDNTLAIFDINDHNRMSENSATACTNKNVILEFRVDNINFEFERISKIGAEIIKPLTTQSWGNTSFWFKDPDGNMIDFYEKTR